MKRSLLAFAAILALGLLLAGSQAFATPPPTIMVQAIGHGSVTGVGGAIACGGGKTNCATAFGSSGGSFTLKATAATGWAFDHWEDVAGCASATCTLTATGDQLATAVFTASGAAKIFTLAADATLDGATPEGVVSNSAGGTPSANYSIDCDGAGGASHNTCSLDVVDGSTITVRETPNAGYFFKNWGGACSSSQQFCSIYMDGTHNVAGDFVASGTNTLTVTVDGAGTVTGGGVNCSDGATCTVDEPANSKVTLRATPSSGYAFTGWSGDCAGTQPTCSVDMSATRGVTATFDNVVPLLLTVNGAGTVSGDGLTCGPGPMTCSGSAAPGSTIQFQATPTAVGGTVTWSGCTSASGLICNYVVSTSATAVSISATFSGGTTGGGGSFVQLSVNVDGNGYVTATGATIYCTAAGGSGCVASVQQGSVVTLKANPASGISSGFDTWAGCPIATSTTCSLTMSTAKSIDASFDNPDDTTYNLTASVTGSGTVSGAGLNCRITGSTACASPQASGADVTITASASPGFVFTGWGGDCTGASPSCTVTMNSDQNVTATFKSTAPATNKLTITVTGNGSVTGGAASCIGKGAKPTTCSSSEHAGSTVALHALAAKGYVFAGWSGSCAGTKPSCSIVMNADATAVATFKPAALAAIAKKPTVVKTATGYRITIGFRAGEAGKLTVTTRPKTTTTVKTIKAAAGTVRIAVTKRGRYTVTLSLRSKSGTHALRYTVRV